MQILTTADGSIPCGCGPPAYSNCELEVEEDTGYRPKRIDSYESRGRVLLHESSQSKNNVQVETASKSRPDPIDKRNLFSYDVSKSSDTRA